MTQFATTYESDGYDGERRGTKWWFHSWGNGSKAEWTLRDEIGRPPTPRELRNADYITLAFRKGRHVQYRTHVGGLDLDPRIRRRPENERDV